MQNLAHSASLHVWENNAPSKPGIKQLAGGRPVTPEAERVVGEITSAGGRAVAIRANISKRAQVERLFAETISAFGQLEIIVKNAGVFPFQPVEEIVEAEFHRQFDISVLGAILVAQEAAKHFPASGGSIINIGSTASANPETNATIYAATNAALDAVRCRQMRATRRRSDPRRSP